MEAVVRTGKEGQHNISEQHVVIAGLAANPVPLASRNHVDSNWQLSKGGVMLAKMTTTRSIISLKPCQVDPV